MANEHPPLDSSQGDAEKYKIQHSISDKARCQRAACKKTGLTIPRGELRFGTWSDNDYFQGYTWKHWRCVTPYQIKDCKNLVDSDPTNLAGFKALIEEAQDHVRRAFDAEEVTDTEYKGMNSAMSDEERDYKLDHASTGRAGCQAPDCKSMEIKIGKGEVRFAYSEYYEGHCSWKYKHWRCTQPEDIAAALHRYGDAEELQGFSSLDEESQDQVKKSFQAGYVVDTDWRGGKATLDKAMTPKRTPKRKSRKPKTEDEDDTEWEATTPKKKTKRSTTGRNKSRNLNADVETQTGGTNEDRGEESKANGDSEEGSAQAVRTPKKREETMPGGMASMLAKLRDGLDL